MKRTRVAQTTFLKIRGGHATKILKDIVIKRNTARYLNWDCWSIGGHLHFQEMMVACVSVMLNEQGG